MRDNPCYTRGFAQLQDCGRPFCLREIPSQKSGEHLPARLDDDSVDAAL